MPDVVNGYITTDDLRESLGDLGAQRLSENLLVRAVNAASRAVDNWTHRRFWADAAPVTKMVPVPTCDPELWLDEDIASTTGLVISTWNGSAYGTVWDPADYQLYPYDANTSGAIYGGWDRIDSVRGLRFDVRSTYSRTGYYPAQITARWGWSFLPDPVAEATLLKAAQLFKRKDAPFGVVQFGDIAAVTITRKDADVVELLDAYCRDKAVVA